VRFGAALSALFLSALVCLLAARPGWPDCQPLTIGVDTSQATSATATVLGDAVGEVFYAPDTLVSSITLWRSFFIDSSTVGLKIYVANVDSLGRPIPQSLILDGPTVYHVLGDSIRPTPFQFVFNPPLVLPRPGKYEIAFQASSCAASFYFIYAYNNPFPDGTLWWHGQTALSLCRLRTDPTEYPLQDLVFQVDFCQPTVPVRRETWGYIKAVYH
jgi:hypothetical protein